MAPYILVVEDDDALAELLQYNLDCEGYEVARAHNGAQALAMVEERQPDAMILDWMLPELSGVEVCRRLREIRDTENLPVLMMTARGEEEDCVRGLDVGADDYLIKPVSMAILFARLRTVLRRLRPNLVEERLVCGDLVLDRRARRVTRAGREIHVGPTEFRLLDYLIQSPGRVFSREKLLDAVWGTNIYVETRTVDVHIGRLRKALNQGFETDPIRTVRSAGYALEFQKNM